MKFRDCCVLVACLTVAAARAHAQSVHIEFKDGRVNLETQNATPRQILAEWAKVGGTRIINADRVPGTPMTIQLTGVAERQALDVVLRAASGYMAAARTTGTGISMLDRVHILPTSTAAPAAAGRGAAPAVQAGRAAVPAFQPPIVDDTLDEVPDVDDQPGRVPNARGIPGQVPQRVGIPNQPGQPVGVEDEQEDVDQPPAPVTTPGNPFGVVPGSNRPGVINAPPPPRGGGPGQAVPGQPNPAQPGR
jgi:hypothetical protein